MLLMFTYEFLQQYWWFVVSLLGGLLVFLLFVQGGNAMIFLAGKTEEERQLIVNSTGRKWEFTFTTLVTFGGAFFASFPLFYSTSFSGAYWVWILILITFVFQAVSYEFQKYYRQKCFPYIPCHQWMSRAASYRYGSRNFLYGVGFCCQQGCCRR